MEEMVEQPDKDSNGAQFEDDAGSMFGKFKDATSLLSAYNNIQAEFTRKSQELSQLKKEKQADGLSKENENALADTTGADTSENNPCDINLAEIDDFDAILSQKLLNFAENKPDIISVLQEVKDEILQNKDLIKMPDGIKIAYRLALEKRKKEPAELLNAPNFVQQFILPNKEITTQIVDEYIKSLATPNSPKLISGQANALAVSPNNDEPKTLGDANKIFIKMLEK